MAQHIININNGQGTKNLSNGSYSATAQVTGYNNASLDPKNLTVVEGTNTYAFKIAADGTLTIHVTDNGTAAGTPIAGAVLYRTDANGTAYGNAVTTNANGNAVFYNTPYSATNTVKVYFKQTASDGEHDFNPNVQTITPNAQAYTYELINPATTPRTFTLVDTNYNGLPIESGALTLSETV